MLPASWLAFSATNNVYWTTGNADPSINTNNDWGIWGDFITGPLFEATGLTDVSIQETAAGVIDGTWTWMASTNAGHIVWWPEVPAGPFVSLPNPYTSIVLDIIRNAPDDGLPTTIVLDGSFDPYSDGEKITISGVTSASEGGSTTEQSYNLTKYIKNNGGTYELYNDQTCTQPWDTSTYWPINNTTGVLTWSHGRYIDALAYANGHFYAGNDDEQIFKSEFGTLGELTWTKVSDLNDSLNYWNDIAYYGAFGTSSSSSVTISETAPSGSNGTLWFNSTDGRMYIKYSGQWIDASPTEPNANQVLKGPNGTVELSDSLNIGDNGSTAGINIKGSGDVEVFGYSTLLDVLVDDENPNALTIRNARVPNNGLELYVGNNGTANIARGDGVDSDAQWLSVDATGTTTISTGVPSGHEWSFNADGTFQLPQNGDIVDSNGTSVLGGGNEITNTDGNDTYSVSVATTGVITMTTARGGIEFGAMPEVGAPNHLHIMRPAGQENATDLFFGDDYNYVRLPAYSAGVEIGSSYNGGTVSTWSFGTDGKLTLAGATNGQLYNGATAGTFTGGATITANQFDSLASPGSPGATINGNSSFTNVGWQYVQFNDQTVYDAITAQIGTSNGVFAVSWGAGSTLSTGYVLVQFSGGINFQMCPVVDDGAGSNTPVDGTWFFDANFGGTPVAGTAYTAISKSGYEWKFDEAGGLTLPDNSVVTGSKQQTVAFTETNVVNGIVLATVSSLILVTPDPTYSGTDPLSIYLPTTDITPGTKISIINYYDGQLNVFLAEFEGPAVTINAWENRDYVLIDHPVDGKYWWETNVYSW
jgi:hypothetical protein